MKMKLTTRMTERGQISVPVAIRNGLGLVAGQRVTWEFDTETRTVTLAPSRDSAKGGAQAALGFAATFREPRRTAYWLAGLDDNLSKKDAMPGGACMPDAEGGR